MNSDSTTDRLTGREREVLRSVKLGRTSRHTAERLGISERTVKFHMGNIFRKLKAGNRAQAVAVALERGLLDR
jgi:LuxR family transcriptional regulator, maltose regulon positive regulatory protein